MHDGATAGGQIAANHMLPLHGQILAETAEKRRASNSEAQHPGGAAQQVHRTCLR